MNRSHSTTFYSSCKHFSLTERKEIASSLSRGFSIRSIARALGRAPSSISREIKRNSSSIKKYKDYQSKKFNFVDHYFVSVYNADAADKLAKQRLGNRGGKFKVTDNNILSFIKDKILVDKWSPAVIAHHLKGKLCFKSIYNYIDRGIINITYLDLTRKVRYHRLKNKSRVLKKQFGTSIDKRPKHINNKHYFGHWEGDCVIGKKGKPALLTLVERKTNQGLIFKLQKKQAFDVWYLLQNLISKNKHIFKSITFDNGIEFARCPELERIGTAIYYAHPYSSFERGMNENFNGMIRRFIPKGKDITNISEEEISNIQNWINNYPRKKFRFKTAQQMFNIELKKHSLTVA